MACAVRFDWGTDGLQRRLEAVRPGMQVEAVVRIASTSSELCERVRRGDLRPCLLVAEEQTAGRGRAGRQWLSSPGASLTFSIAMPLAAADWSGLSLAVGLAIAEALDPCGQEDGSPRIGLKWPNDLMLCPGGAGELPRKLGGILVESIATGGRPRHAVIGVGLNLAPQPLPGFEYGHACLRELWPQADAPAVLATVAPALVRAVADFDARGFAPLTGAYAQRDLLAGRRVSTQLGEGVADGVDADGALWLKAGGERLRVVSGEVGARLVVRAATEATPC